MDGAFRPNTLLETAETFASVAHPEALLVYEGRLLVASSRPSRLPSGGRRAKPYFAASKPPFLPWGPFRTVVWRCSCCAEIRFLGGRFDGRVITEVAGRRIHAPTALATAGESVVYVADGSATSPPTTGKAT